MGEHQEVELTIGSSVAKDEARKRIRSARSELAAQGSADGSGDSATCGALAAFLDLNVEPGRFVIVYDAMADEVDLTDLLALSASPSERYGVTRTPERDSPTPMVLTLHPWGGPMEDHPYGYTQPSADAPQIADEQVGAVIVPALAFDRHGNRLGRGKGYYDRLLARLSPECLRIGMTAGLIVDALPHDHYDIAMTHLATADGVEAV